MVLQQRQQGRAGIQIALAVGQVSVGQQHLRAAHAIFAQFGFVHLRQAHLPDCGGGLQLVQFLRSAGPAEPLHAFGNRSARHHHQFAPLGSQSRQLPTPVADRLGINTSTLIRHQAGANLDDDATSALERNAHGMLSSDASDATGKRGSISTMTRWAAATWSKIAWIRGWQPSRVRAEISNTGPVHL